MSDEPNAVIDGREAYVGALRELLLGLAPRDVRSVWCVDTDFLDWPLGEAAVVEALTGWARPHGRMLRMIGGDFGPAARHHPRFAEWRRDWSHRFEAWRPIDPAQGAELPGLLVAGDRALELLDRVRLRARWVSGPAALRQLTEQCDALLHHCEPAWSATTLGL